MTDAHAHLTFGAYDLDREEVIRKSFKSGISKIITVATTLEQTNQCIDLAEKHPQVYATAGIHPHHADKIPKNWEEKLQKLADHNKVISIGECGLDNFHYHSNGTVDKEIQKKVFIGQIQIASVKGLPLQIHNRLAWNDMKNVLTSQTNNSASFSYKPHTKEQSSQSQTE